jgi:hypothetical protein
MVAFTWHSGSDTSRASRVTSVPETAAVAAVPIPRHRRRRAAAIAIYREASAVVVMGLAGVVLMRPTTKELVPLCIGSFDMGLSYYQAHNSCHVRPSFYPSNCTLGIQTTADSGTCSSIQISDASNRGLKKETRKQKKIRYVDGNKKLSVTYHGLFLQKKKHHG